MGINFLFWLSTILTIINKFNDVSQCWGPCSLVWPEYVTYTKKSFISTGCQLLLACIFSVGQWYQRRMKTKSLIIANEWYEKVDGIYFKNILWHLMVVKFCRFEYTTILKFDIISPSLSCFNVVKNLIHTNYHFSYGLSADCSNCRNIIT